MSRDIERPEIQSTFQHGGTYLSHPAFGMISYSIRSGDPGPLFGSELPGHYGHVVVTIMTAEQCVTTDGEVRYVDGKKLIEVAMTHMEWATFLTSSNRLGVPCTLQVRPDPEQPVPLRMFGLPEPSTQQLKVSQDRVREAGQKIDDRLNRLEASIESIVSETKLSDKQQSLLKARLLVEVGKARQDIRSNIPWYVQRLQEAVDAVSSSAKADIDGFVTGVAHRLGVASLTKLLTKGD